MADTLVTYVDLHTLFLLDLGMLSLDCSCRYLPHVAISARLLEATIHSTFEPDGRGQPVACIFTQCISQKHCELNNAVKTSD